MELLALAQGFYFFVTGVWPLVSIGSDPPVRKRSPACC